MIIDSFTLCVPTQRDNYMETPLYNSVEKFGGFRKRVNHCFAERNTTPLSVVYNRAIEGALNNGSDCLILVHDDVILEHDPIPKLEVLFDDYDLVGVAGCSQAEIKAPALWHIMGGGFTSPNGFSTGNLRGAVSHMGPSGKKHMTSFGEYPARVIMIDGVFMALSRKVMEKVRFDETNPAGFHFYDIQLSLDTHNQGFKVGVGDILITHESPGLREFTPEFLKGQEWFLNKYGR